MPLDPTMRELLAAEAADGLADLSDLTPADARRRTEAAQQALDQGVGGYEAVRRTVDVSIPLLGRRLKARAYYPLDETVRPPFPTVVYFHGGGWVVGDLRSSDATCRELANRARCAVVSIAYRLAPEHKFPAPVDDAIGATRWIADVRNARRAEIDPTRIAVAGDSAGGNLAAVVAVDARDAGAPKLVGQVLLCPVTDTRLDRPSIRSNAHGYGFQAEFLPYMWTQYLRSAADADDPRVAVVRTARVDRLPPAFVLTAEFDMLRDEGEEYAERLRSSGVSLTHHRYEGMVHNFIEYRTAASRGRSATREGRAAIDEIAAWLRARFEAR